MRDVRKAFEENGRQHGTDNNASPPCPCRCGASIRQDTAVRIMSSTCSETSRLTQARCAFAYSVSLPALNTSAARARMMLNTTPTAWHRLAFSPSGLGAATTGYSATSSGSTASSSAGGGSSVSPCPKSGSSMPYCLCRSTMMRVRRPTIEVGFDLEKLR